MSVRAPRRPRAKWKLGPAQANGFIPLSEAKTIPLGSSLDTTGGKVEINTAVGTRSAGRVQSGQFYDGMFQVKQIGAKTGPVTEMVMNDPLSCPSKTGKKVSKKRGSGRNYGPYGFLPGVRSPEAIELERSGGRGSGNWYAYSPYYGYAPVGVATFYHGRWNGGSFGPCWTRTPIGMMWNCGR